MSLENCDRVSDYVSSEGYLEAPSCFMLFCVAEAREREREGRRRPLSISLADAPFCQSGIGEQAFLPFSPFFFLIFFIIRPFVLGVCFAIV